MPDVMSLDQEMTWEKEHGFWGNFDSYEKSEYVIKGHNGYEKYIT